MMKKILLTVFAIALVCLSAMPCLATTGGTEMSRPIETTGIVTDRDGNAMDYPVWVYSISIYADAANSYMGVYNCDTSAELNASTIYPMDEIGEASQYDTATRPYTKPMYFSDGVGIIIFTGVGFVEYGPEP